MFLLASTKKAARLLNDDFDWAALCICFLVMAAVHNISESSFDSFTKQVPATVLFLSTSIRANVFDKQMDDEGR